MAATLTNKTYPPIIEGTLPAFYKNEKNGTAILAVPFALNRASSISEIEGISVKIKTVQSNTLLATLTSSTPTEDLENLVAHFALPETLLDRILVGQFLKIQLAFIVGRVVGYYSTVGVVKYTSRPSVVIKEASYKAVADSIPSFRRTYTGCYTNEHDSSEKVYQYIFNLYDTNQNIVQSSDWCLHNAGEDLTLYESIDQFTFTSNLQNYHNYYIEYGVKTTNDLEIYSTRFLVTYLENIFNSMDADLIAANDFDNGCIRLSLNPHGINYTVGDYYIARSTKENGYEDWEDVKRIRFSHAQLLSEWEFRDFTIEQGKIYKYSLQQINSYGAFSARLCAEPIRADFEDMFLFDGVHQLKIRFNPKVSSFKIDRLEQKVDTIGSKYPFFFRNGRVEYREFPISGLISYLADDDQLFLTNKQLQVVDPTMQRRSATLLEYRRVTTSEFYDATQQYYFTNLDDVIVEYTYNSPIEWSVLVQAGKLWAKNEHYHADVNLSTDNWRTTQLVDYNFYAERKFKTTVLEWLGNGKPKLFKSPGEGNYLVRLMNISLSPEDKTSRLLHTFSCTAYEIAKYSYQNLINTKIVQIEEEQDRNIYGYETISFVDLGGRFKHGQINKQPIAGYLFIEGMRPGDYVLYGDKEETAQKIIIGNTGSLKIEVGKEMLQNIYISTAADEHTGGFVHNSVGQLTYRYILANADGNGEKSTFDTVEESALINRVKTFSDTKTRNVLAELQQQTIKEKLFTIQYLSFQKKEIKELFMYGDKYYRDREGKQQVKFFDDISVYLINDAYYLYDDVSENLVGPLDIDFSYTVNDTEFTESAHIIFPKEEYSDVTIGNGFIVHVGYQVQYTTYYVEKTARMKLIAETYGKDSEIYLTALQGEIDAIVQGG